MTRHPSDTAANSNNNPPALLPGKGILRDTGGRANNSNNNASHPHPRQQQQQQQDTSADLSYIPLPHEKTYYEELFLAASGYSDDTTATAGCNATPHHHQQEETMPMDKAWEFFSLSNLPFFHLKIIMSTAKKSASSATAAAAAAASDREAGATSSDDVMTKTEFFVAVRLVQLRQCNIKVTDLNLNEVAGGSGSACPPPFVRPANFDGVSDVTVPLPQALLGGGTTNNKSSQKNRSSSSSSRRRKSLPASLLKHSRSSPEVDMMQSSPEMHFDVDADVPPPSAMNNSWMHDSWPTVVGNDRGAAAPNRPHRIVQRGGDATTSSTGAVAAQRKGGTTSTAHQREKAAALASSQRDGSGRTAVVAAAAAAAPPPCCLTCSDRSDQTSKLVLKVWEMEKELVETRNLVLELKVQVDVMRKEASDRDAMYVESEREILKKRQRQIEKMKSRSQDQARRSSGHQHRSSRREKKDDGRVNEGPDRKLTTARGRVRSSSLGRLGSDRQSRSRSNPVPYAFDDHSSGAQYAPARSTGQRQQQAMHTKRAPTGGGGRNASDDHNSSGAQYAPPASRSTSQRQQQVHTERMPVDDDGGGRGNKPKKKTRLKRSDSLKSFSDLLHDDDDHPEESDARSLGKLGAAADAGGKHTGSSNDVKSIITGGPSWFGLRLSKPRGKKDKKEDELEEEEQERVPDMILASDQSGGVNEVDAKWLS